MVNDRFEWAMKAGTSSGAIGPWLESLGLGRYRQIFIAEEIDLQILPDLTEAELAALGLPLGPRKKILQAVRALRGGAPKRHRRDGAGRADPETSASPRRDAERRNLTVLNCDMVNSTALANRLDPEQLREVMHPYFDACSEVVDRFGGFVAKYTGDGLIAYFGYPAAHEDAAERAVRAGLQMIEMVGALAPRPGISLQARLGIATGLTVVGDLIGKGAAREEAVVGAAPPLAARLQGLAPPDGIIISNATRRLVRGIFELEDLGRVELKGFPRPPRAWRVLGRLQAESRFAAARRDRQTGLVDRDGELALLLERWRLACTGAGQLVMLSGEAGLGKSRLIDAVRGQMTAGAHDVVLLQCANYYRNSAFYPVIEWLERTVQLTPEDTPRSKLAKLQAKLGLSTEALGRIAELLSVSTDLVEAAADPRVRKEQLQAALVAILIGTASGPPRLLVLEDAHWCDASTLELLGRIIASVASRSILLIVTYRPEFELPWPPADFATELVLDRLEQRHSLQLVARLSEAEGLTPELQSHIVDKAEGVPLFVEELTKSVLESGLADESVERSGGKFQLAVPATLHDALMARLDRLASVKVIAQTGAALGREFPYRMLAACTGFGGRRLQQGLVQLAEAGLLLCNGQPPDATYTFKHALVRDVAYNSMLLSRRPALHAEIGHMLETKFPAAVTIQPEVLAHHYTEAGLLEQAIPWWQRAADRALRQSAHVEATSHLETALTLLARQAASPERNQLETALRFRLVAPLVVTTGFASPQSEENYARIAQLTEQAGSTIEALRLLWGQAAMALVRSDLSKAEALADRLIRRATRASLKNGPVLGHSLMAYSALVRGDIRRARDRFDVAMKEFSPEGSRFVFDDWPYDIPAALASRRMLVLQQQGCLDQAMRGAEEALAEARRIGSPGTEAYVLMHIALANLIAGDVDGANFAATPLRRLADQFDMKYYRWHEEVVRGWVEAKSGAMDRGIARMRGGLEQRRQHKANLWVPVYVLGIAELLMANNRHAEAFPIFSECAKLCRELQQHYIEPELHRLRGVAFAATGAARTTIEAAFELALQTARDQGARLFELRAATSLARFWQRFGRYEAASLMLAPILAGFTEGFASADVRGAQAVLARLAASAR
jgi:class 3 adenylate cyclase/tetratricopeptide (TPR) repeat protein